MISQTSEKKASYERRGGIGIFLNTFTCVCIIAYSFMYSRLLPQITLYVGGIED